MNVASGRLLGFTTNGKGIRWPVDGITQEMVDAGIEASLGVIGGLDLRIEEQEDLVVVVYLAMTGVR